MKFIKFLFTSLFCISSFIYPQKSYNGFEKKYLDFHTKWDNGINISLQGLDSLFKDCPDKTRFPHYFIYKGDLLAHAGFPALGLKYLLLAEKYTYLGYESKKLTDHRAVLCYKIGRHYFDLKLPLKVEEYILKGRTVLKKIVDKQPIIQGKYDFGELEIRLKYQYSNNKSEAIEELKQLYLVSKPHRDVLYFIPQSMLLRGVEMALNINDITKAKEFLILLYKDPKFKNLKKYYSLWYYEVERKYLLKTKNLEKAKIFNDSIFAIKPLNLKKKEGVFANYIEIYKTLKKDNLVNTYRDSLNNNYKKQKIKRQKSIVLLTTENDKYEDFIKSLSAKSKKQKIFWIALILITSLIFIGILRYIIKKNRKETLQDLKKKEKRQLKHVNNLSKKYTLTKREREIIVELIKQKTNKEIATILFITVPTVKFHISNILAKLNAKNRIELIDKIKI